MNMLGKLIEKVIGERIQYYTITNNFIHSNQLEKLKQQSTFDAGNFLTYLIHSDQIKMSTLAFNVA